MFKNLKDLIKFQPSKSSQSNKGKRYDFNFLNLIEKWEPIVGEMVFKHTRPLRLNKNRLVIVTDHPAFSQQLSFLKEPLLKKIIKEFPSLQNLNDLQFETNAQLFVLQSKKMLPGLKEEKKESKIHPLSPRYAQLKKQAKEEVQTYYTGSEFRDELERIYLNILISKESN